VVKGKMVI